MTDGIAMSTSPTAFRNWFAQSERPSVVVLGNEKGGSGKSTTAMHLIVGLMKRGYSVGTIDLDPRQATLSHYIQNRVRWARTPGRSLELPQHRRVSTSDRLSTTTSTRRDEQIRALATSIESLQDCDYIVIDTPGADTPLSHLGHVVADTLITPMNDSFVDLDVLVHLDAGNRNILGPSTYARTVMARVERRRAMGGPALNWIVLRTRLAQLDSRNGRDLEHVLTQLGDRIGFRLVPGLCERVVYRELFNRGLTVLDVADDEASVAGPSGPSRNAARWEVEALVDIVEGARPPVH